MWKRFVLILAMLVFGTGASAAAKETVTLGVAVTYGQTEARKQLAMINAFRTGADAWYWNEDDTTKTVYNTPGGVALQPLAYDYGLEKLAMQRAAEIVLSFGHERPGGGYTWDYGPFKRDENIAAGYVYNATAAEVLEQWKETELSYRGQGHRRNLLDPRFTAVGIAYARIGKYHYWVQVFGENALSAVPTEANNAPTVVEVNILPSAVTKRTVRVSPGSLSVSCGSAVALPKVTAEITLKYTWPERACAVDVACVWSVTNVAVAKISGGTLTGLRKGSVALMANVFGESLAVPVTVTGQENASDAPKPPDIPESSDPSTSPQLSDVPRLPAVGKEIRTSSARYKVTGIDASGAITVAYTAPAKKNVVHVSVPAKISVGGISYKVTSLAKRAFAGCRKLKTVSVSGSVRSIGKQAFQNCRALRRVTIGKKVKYIRKEAFRGCKNLRRIVIKSRRLTKRSVGAKAFQGIYKKAVFRVPVSKKKAYKKILSARGAASQTKILKR